MSNEENPIEPDSELLDKLHALCQQIAINDHIDSANNLMIHNQAYLEAVEVLESHGKKIT